MPPSQPTDDSTTASRPKPDRKLVVAALCADREGRVMLTRRREEQPMGGLWELPGGKVEGGESPAVALAREIEEELGCPSEVGAIYEVIHHVYPRFEVVMLVFRVTLRGVPTSQDVAEIAWVPPARLLEYSVLAADVELIARIARQGGVDPVRAPARRAATFDSLTRDAATGCFNAHYLHDRLIDEQDRAARYGRPLSLILIDLDDLGALNDRHGRSVGDQVIGQLVALMTQNARAIDRVGRTSGGSFALVLPETPAGAALGISERLRADIAARRFIAHGNIEGVRHEVRCTVSCGVAAMRSGRSPAADGILARADAALWRAKLAGRNRTVVDSSEAPAEQPPDV